MWQTPLPQMPTSLGFLTILSFSPSFGSKYNASYGSFQGNQEKLKRKLEWEVPIDLLSDSPLLRLCSLANFSIFLSWSNCSSLSLKAISYSLKIPFKEKESGATQDQQIGNTDRDLSILIVMAATKKPMQFSLTFSSRKSENLAFCFMATS